MSSSPEQQPLASSPRTWRLRRVVRRALRPFELFLQVEAASGVVLLAAAALALLWANSPWAGSYRAVLGLPLGLRVGSFALFRSLEWVVNDVLMVIFFFVVGLEIRHELHAGELSRWRRAVLPLAAAVGGMLVPALLYAALAPSAEARRGWGIPMATDIAFAVGVLTLLGKRVPAALRVLLLGLAVIDDLGAIVIIALFYSSGVRLSGLGVAAVGVALVLLLQRLGVRAKWSYLVPGVVIWSGVYGAGIHPTIAGVLLGLLTPVHAVAPREAEAPAEGLLRALHPWVAYGVMPIFALSNSGVALRSGSGEGARLGVTIAVALALVIGKPIGVLLASWLALRLRLAMLPAAVNARHLCVLGLVAGIGFTMSLFIAQLAFDRAALLEAAKRGVLLASGVALVLSLVAGWLLLPPTRRSRQA